MIEWYRLDFGVGELEHDVDRVLRVACAELRDFPPARNVSYRDAMRDACGVDCASAEIREMRSALAAHGIVPARSEGWEHDEWLDLLMGGVVGPRLGHEAPTFVHDYPASQAALARLRELPDGSRVAERFELFVDGIELANGFRELGDATEQRRRFEQDLATRRRRGQAIRPLDERLLAALASGLPDCAGVALGFDRLVMAAHRLTTLASVMAFPESRA
jgi:lysyl-tRNA synthetase class 2